MASVDQNEIQNPDLSCEYLDCKSEEILEKPVLGENPSSLSSQDTSSKTIDTPLKTADTMPTPLKSGSPDLKNSEETTGKRSLLSLLDDSLDDYMMRITMNRCTHATQSIMNICEEVSNKSLSLLSLLHSPAKDPPAVSVSFQDPPQCKTGPERSLFEMVRLKEESMKKRKTKIYEDKDTLVKLAETVRQLFLVRGVSSMYFDSVVGRLGKTNIIMSEEEIEKAVEKICELCPEWVDVKECESGKVMKCRNKNVGHKMVCAKIREAEISDD